MMMSLRPFFLALCAALPLAAGAQGSAPASAAAPAQSSHVSDAQALEWFNLLDANHDGCISRAEAQAVIRFAPKLARDFDAADVNHDGCITPEEIRALAERRRAERDARRAAEARQHAASDPQAGASASAPEAASAP